MSILDVIKLLILLPVAATCFLLFLSALVVSGLFTLVFVGACYFAAWILAKGEGGMDQQMEGY